MKIINREIDWLVDHLFWSKYKKTLSLITPIKGFVFHSSMDALNSIVGSHINNYCLNLPVKGSIYN
jgi:hypothetical protein